MMCSRPGCGLDVEDGDNAVDVDVDVDVDGPSLELFVSFCAPLLVSSSELTMRGSRVQLV